MGRPQPPHRLVCLYRHGYRGAHRTRGVRGRGRGRRLLRLGTRGRPYPRHVARRRRWQHREQLLADVTARQQRVAALELELGRLEAQNILELEQRRAAAEVELRQEREALRRLEDRLKRVEQQRGVTPPTKP